MDNEIHKRILSNYPDHKREGLIPLLQEIQSEKGYLTEEILETVGAHLNIPANKVYCIATFYDQFRFKPLGRNHVKVCQGTACHLFGSSSYLTEIENQLKVTAGGTSRDKNFSLEVTNCLGACDSAPVIMVNDTIHTRVSPDELTRILRSLKEKSE